MLRGRVALVLLLAAAPCGADAPLPSPRPADVAAEVLAARAKGDAAALERLSRSRLPSPFLVVEALLLMRTTGDPVAAPPEEAPLEALRAWAGRFADRAEGSRMAALVPMWGSWTRDERAAEAHARATLAAMEAAAARGRAEEVLALAAADRDAPQARASLALPRLLVRAGDAALAARRPADAAAWGARGEELARELTWTALEADALRVEALASDRQQDYPRLEAVARRWLAAARAAGDPEQRFQSRAELAWALQGQGRNGEALALVQELRTDPYATASVSLAADLRQKEGTLLGFLGRDADAFAALDDAVAMALRAGDADGAAFARERRAQLHERRGESTAALALLEQVADDYRSRGRAARLAAVRGNIGKIWMDLGRTQDAAACFREAFEAARAAGARGTAADWLRKLGEAQAGNLDFAAAEASLDEALRTYRELGNARKVAVTQLALGRTLVGAGRAREALEAMRDLPALDDAHATAARRWAVAEARARALFDLGRSDEAQILLERAAAEQERGGVSPRPLAQRLLARIHLAAGRPSEALSAALVALERRGALGAGFGDDETHDVREFVHVDADLALEAALRALSASAPDPAVYVNGALRALESSRARWLGEQLALGPALAAANVPSALIEAEAASRRGAEEAQRRLMAATFGPRPDEEEARSQRALLESSQQQWREVRARIARAVRRAAHLVPPAPPDDALRLARSLPADAALVYYHLGVDRAYALALSGGAAPDARLVSLGPTPAILRAIEGWRRLVAAPDAPEEPLARELGRLLLAPVLPALAGTRRLLVSPDGALAFLPFEALVVPGEGASRRLVEAHEVVYVPSAAVLSLLGEQEQGVPRGAGVVALGDPVYPGEATTERADAMGAERPRGGLSDLSRLPASGREAREVAALFPEGSSRVLLREHATLAGLDAALGASPRWRAVHLACHGFFDPGLPRFSGVVLAGGEVLGLAQIAQRSVPADLVVLSACETGEGALRTGEGVEGLVRGFFLAGAPRVVVSDWRVADEGTRSLMLAFYSGFAKDGLSASAALARAKRAAIAAGGAGAHPSRWAAFVLWGLAD